MVFIIADNKEIRRCIRKLVTLSEKGGAEFADDLVLRCTDGGSLSVEARAGNDGPVLIKMPGFSLVPVERFKLAIVNDEIVMTSCDPGVSAERVALMETILELYNLTGKIATHRKTSPWALIATQPELASYLTEAKGENATKHDRVQSGWTDDSVLDTFLNSRTIVHRNDPQSAPETVLMPVLDFVNHHYSSTFFEDMGNPVGGAWTAIKKSQPLEGSRECFVCYSFKDVFGTFLAYGFIDDKTPHVRSIPLEINLPGFGSIWVRDRVFAEGHKNVTKQFEDLRELYLPNVLEKKENFLDVSFLVIPGLQAPNALRRVLDILTKIMNSDHPKQQDMIALAEEQVIAKNKAYYQDLRNVVQALKLTDPQQETIRNDFNRMCDLQLDRLQSYKML